MRIFRKSLVPAILLLVIVVALIAGGPSNRLDQEAIRALASIRADSPGLTHAAIILTHAGSAYGTIGLGLVAALALWLTGAGRRAVLLAAGVAGERLVADGLKLIIDRPRPAFDAHPVLTSSSSFPSGHAANTMGAFLIIAMVTAPPRFRSAAMIAALLASLAVGATRPYLGVHWPSDVIGGWALGLVAVWIVLRVGERSGVLAFEPQHDVVGRHRAAIGENEAA